MLNLSTTLELELTQPRSPYPQINTIVQRLLLMQIGNSVMTLNYSAPSGHDGFTCSRRGSVMLLVVVSRTMYSDIGKPAYCHITIPLTLVFMVALKDIFLGPVPPHVLCGLRGPPTWAW